MYIDKPLKDYLDDLAARKPAPGGGSAAALAAAMGTSLMAMVANFTMGKKGYEGVEGNISEIMLATVKFDSELRNLIDEDVAVFKKLTTALKDRRHDDAQLDELYKNAMEPPFLVCEIAGKCMTLCRELAEFGNKNLITDTATAVMLLESAFFSAKYNVYVNLKCVKDTDYIEKIHRVLMALEDTIPKLKEEILEMCEDAISS